MTCPVAKGSHPFYASSMISFPTIFSPRGLSSSSSERPKVLVARTQGCRGPQGCETTRLPHFLDNRLTDGGEVVSLTRRPPFAHQEDSWHSFLLEAESTTGS
jgi:hypothetical protein